jgi:O-antigen ligase
MTTEAETPQNSDVSSSAPRPLATSRRIGLTLFVLLCISVGIASLLLEPIYIAVGLIAILLMVLILLYPYFGLLVFYLDLVVRPAVLWPQLGVLHPDAVLGGALLISVIIHKKFHGETFIFFQERMSWLLTFFVGALVASVSTSVWPSNSVSCIINLLTTLTFFLVIINVVNNENRLKGMLWLFILAGGYDAISSAIAYFTGNLIVAQGIERAESLTGADPNTLAISLVLAIPFMAFALGWIKRRYLRFVSLMLAIAAVFTIAITGSRTGVIGLLAALFFIWLISKRRLITMMVFLVAIAIGWVSLPAQYKERYSTITSGEVDASTQGRYDAWKAGLGMFYSRPFLGVGIDNFPVAYASGDFSEKRFWLRPHNLYIQLISELGLVGLVAWTALIYYMMRQNFRLRKLMRERGAENGLLRAVSYSITCSIGTLFFMSIFGHSLYRMHWYWCCALTVVLWRLLRDANPEEVQEPDRGRLPTRST